jgi:DNA-3-methyladenine glycosylase II
MPIASLEEVTRAAQHLAQYDPVLAPVIAQVGLCTIRPQRQYYAKLIDSIISQQLSVKAARSIEQRFKALFNSESPDPAVLLETPTETLRSAGLSNAKVRYIRDLAEHIVEGKLVFDRFETLTNDEIITELTAVKGIGDWTAHMFLMFCMGRLDILAIGDLGIRNGARALYGFENTPTPSEITELAEKNQWHPYETIACWYLWRNLDTKPEI